MVRAAGIAVDGDWPHQSIARLLRSARRQYTAYRVQDTSQAASEITPRIDVERRHQRQQTLERQTERKDKRKMTTDD